MIQQDKYVCERDLFLVCSFMRCLLTYVPGTRPRTGNTKLFAKLTKC